MDYEDDEPEEEVSPRNHLQSINRLLSGGLLSHHVQQGKNIPTFRSDLGPFSWLFRRCCCCFLGLCKKRPSKKTGAGPRAGNVVVHQARQAAAARKPPERGESKRTPVQQQVLAGPRGAAPRVGREREEHARSSSTSTSSSYDSRDELVVLEEDLASTEDEEGISPRSDSSSQSGEESLRGLIPSDSEDHPDKDQEKRIYEEVVRVAQRSGYISDSDADSESSDEEDQQQLPPPRPPTGAGGGGGLHPVFHHDSALDTTTIMSTRDAGVVRDGSLRRVFSGKDPPRLDAHMRRWVGEELPSADSEDGDDFVSVVAAAPSHDLERTPGAGRGVGVPPARVDEEESDPDTTSTSGSSDTTVSEEDHKTLFPTASALMASGGDFIKTSCELIENVRRKSQLRASTTTPRCPPRSTSPSAPSVDRVRPRPKRAAAPGPARGSLADASNLDSPCVLLSPMSPTGQHQAQVAKRKRETGLLSGGTSVRQTMKMVVPRDTSSENFLSQFDRQTMMVSQAVADDGSVLSRPRLQVILIW